MAITLDGTLGITSPDFEPSGSTTPTNGLFLPAANAVGFATNSSERVRIDSSGNVGIGTSSPLYPLSVNGVGNFYSGVAGLGRIFLGDPADPSGYVGMYRSAQGPTNSTTAGNNLNFASITGYTFSTGVAAFGSQTERLRIDSSGNVGIGTSSPAAKLDVQGGRSYFAANSDAFATYLRYNTSTAGVFLGSPSANAFQISGSGGGSYLNIDSSGNVGIGTSSPNSKLQVAGRVFANGSLTSDSGDSAFGASGSRAFMDWNGSQARIGSLTGGGVGGTVGLFVNNALRILLNTDGSCVWKPDSSTSAMTLDAGGNLLVGDTTTPIAARVVSKNTVGQYSYVSNAANQSGGFYHFACSAAGSAPVGGITSTTTTTSFNTSSDQRLKTNIAPAGSATQSILDFPVDQFDWIASGEHQDFGAVAQKVVNVIPEMVSVPSDSDEMWGIDWSKAVPRLIKTIQELTARLEALENKS